MRDDHKRQSWEEDLWFRGVTDADGQVQIEVEYTAIDRSRGSKPGPESDAVTGQPFVVTVERDQTYKHTSIILMNRAVSVKGKLFTVIVNEIQQPRYVETQLSGSGQIGRKPGRDEY